MHDGATTGRLGLAVAVAVACLLVRSVESFSVLPRRTTMATRLSTAVSPLFNSQKVQEETITAAETQAETSTSTNNNDNQQQQTQTQEKVVINLEKNKTELLDLLPRMTGEAHEFKRVETLINNLESIYQPIETLEFLNLLQQGEWQLLFSTNSASTPSSSLPSPQVFRMREMYQKMTCDQLTGTADTIVIWDLAQAMPGQFDCTGTFTVKNSYEINQGARVLLDLQEHVLQPKGKIPDNVPALVGLLHRAMPKELFDPSEHATDTTYLDGNLKIVRYTGPKFEGVRDIWIRRGSLSIDPTAKTTTMTKDFAESAATTTTTSALSETSESSSFAEEVDDLFLED